MSTLRDELTAVYRERGRLTPRVVVDTARDPEHPLHHRFEWDTEEAAERYRLVQARELIRSVKIVYQENPETGEERRVRAFVPTRQPDEPSSYQPTEEALADPFTRQLVLREFERAVLALKRQYGHLQEYDALLRSKGLNSVA